MSALFISYRREDTAGHAGRLCDRLSSRLGEDRVFMDVQDMKPGQNFVRSIDEAIARCAGVIAVIGPRWLEMLERKSEGGDDFVRHELSAALARNLPVIPVLVGGARMPDASELPPELSPLSRYHAIEIRDDRFDQDVTRLLDAIQGDRAAAGGVRALRSAGPARVLGGVGALLLVALTVVTFLRSEPDAPDIDGEWVAAMQNPGQASYRIGLTFQRIGDTVTGTVRYPTGEGAIQDGQLKGNTLTFYTEHIPQFESEPAVIRFTAEVEGETIRLTTSHSAGVTPGVATRATSP